MCEFNVEDVIQQIVMEKLLLSSDSWKKSTTSPASSPEIKSKLLDGLFARSNASPADVMDGKSTANKNIPVANISENRDREETVYKQKLRYLMVCYERIGIEETLHPKVWFVGDNLMYIDDNMKHLLQLCDPLRVCTLFMQHSVLSYFRDLKIQNGRSLFCQQGTCAFLMRCFYWKEVSKTRRKHHGIN